MKKGREVFMLRGLARFGGCHFILNLCQPLTKQTKRPSVSLDSFQMAFCVILGFMFGFDFA